jgi:D-alanyl-D-alanine dipeptidase
MLEEAARSMPPGVFLGVVDAWRPFARQQRIYDFMMRSAVEAFPDRNLASLRRTVCRWVAPTDQKAPPGHCTGAAVDVWLVDENGENIDVKSPYDRWEASATYTLGLTAEAEANRALLVNAMLLVGFSNCRDEWWHYSFGDAGWAVRVQEPTCQYGRVDLPEELYREQELASIELLKGRPNPFLPDA